jgi:hypothetical protein
MSATSKAPRAAFGTRRWHHCHAVVMLQLPVLRCLRLCIAITGHWSVITPPLGPCLQVLDAANAAGYRVMHTGWQDSLADTCVKEPHKCKKWVAAAQLPPNHCSQHASCRALRASCAVHAAACTYDTQAHTGPCCCAAARRYQHSFFLGSDEFRQLLQRATYVPVLRRFEGFEMMGVEALFTGTRPIVYDAMIETKPYRWASQGCILQLLPNVCS